MNADLPAPVARYVEVAYPDGVPEVETAAMEASGRFRRCPLPWLPMRTTIRLRPCVERVADLFVRLGPLTLMRVLDAYVDGHGITKVGRSADVGAEIDQGGFHAMLVEAVLFPSSWSRVTGLAWRAVDEHTATLRLPFGDGVEVATARFDPGTGLPATYRAPRYKAVGGPKVDWRVDMAEWMRSGRLSIPRRIVVTWADDPGPWFQARFTSVTRDVDIGPAVERARGAIADATRAPAE